MRAVARRLSFWNQFAGQQITAQKAARVSCIHHTKPSIEPQPICRLKFPLLKVTTSEYHETATRGFVYLIKTAGNTRTGALKIYAFPQNHTHG